MSKPEELYRELVSIIDANHLDRFEEVWKKLVMKKYLTRSVIQHEMQYIPKQVPTFWRAIEYECAKYYDISVTDLYQTTRVRKYIYARNMIYWIVRTHYRQISLNFIGKTYDKHHCTILHGIKKTDDFLRLYADTRNILKHICEALTSAGYLEAQEIYTKFEEQHKNGTYKPISTSRDTRKKSRRTGKNAKSKRSRGNKKQ